ncbi:MAG: extracellular solute-binding protein, partial [Pseudomonadota bacterium]
MRKLRFGGVAVRSILSVVVLGALSVGTAQQLSAAELNIYSHRQPFLIKPFLEAYTKKTGTKINVVYASKGLAQRLQAEGSRSPADVVLTVDIARLWVYADKKLLAAVDSEVLKKNIPARLRDPDNRWFAFSKRARIIVASKAAKDAVGIRSYADLADPKWKGRVCSRPGSHVYNRALVASVINAKGVDDAQKWASGVIENLAR